MSKLRISVAVVVFVATALVVFFLSAPARWVAATRKQSIKMLSEAESEPQLKEAVGRLGVVVRATDGSWVAIRYRDDHYFTPIRSLAIAMDSGGRWFQCDRHFCGWLPSFARERAEGADVSTLRVKFSETGDPKGQAGYEKMESLFASTNLESLRDALKQMDFTEFEPRLRIPNQSVEENVGQSSPVPQP